MKYYVPLIVICVLSFGACKKTVDFKPLAQTRITEYKITNLQDTVLYASIDHVERVITAYLPFGFELSVIDPEIKVSDGSALKEEIVPVSVDDTTTSYTVLAPDGQTATYKLNIVILGPPSLHLSWQAPGTDAYPNGVLPLITGNFYSTNASLAKMELISISTGAETSLLLNDAYITASSKGRYNYANALIPYNIDTGYYKVSVHFFGNQTILKDELHIIHRQPNVVMPSKNVKQGDEITYQALNSVILGLKKVSVTVNGNKYDLPVIKYDLKELTIKIPDDFPIGEHGYVPFELDFEGWASVNREAKLIVNAK
jgi:hypothetical protein